MNRIITLILLFLAIQIVASAENKNPILFRPFKGFGNASPKSIKSNGGDFKQGVMIFSTGYGAPNTVAMFTEASSINSGIGPLHLKFEFAASDVVGLGISINYASKHGDYISKFPNTYLNPVTLDIMRTSINARINFHFFTEEKLDMYTGVGIGYRFGSYNFLRYGSKEKNNTYEISYPLGFEMTVGLRYYFSKLFGVYMEMGLARSLIQAGIVFKMGKE